MQYKSLSDRQKRAKDVHRTVLSVAAGSPKHSQTVTATGRMRTVKRAASLPRASTHSARPTGVSMASAPPEAMPPMDTGISTALLVAEDDGWPTNVSRR